MEKHHRKERDLPFLVKRAFPRTSPAPTPIEKYRQERGMRDEISLPSRKHHLPLEIWVKARFQNKPQNKITPPYYLLCHETLKRLPIKGIQTLHIIIEKLKQNQKQL